MKKLPLFVLTGALSLSVFLGGGNVSAQTSEQGQLLTEQHTINWEQLWDNSSLLPKTTSIGVANVSSPGAIQLASYGSLATGSTAVSGTSSAVKSTGKTTGKVVTTVVSATTSLRDVAHGITSQGGKRMAVAKFTATSTTELANTTGSTPYTGLTVHTATDSGVLYSSATGNTKAF